LAKTEKKAKSKGSKKIASMKKSITNTIILVLIILAVVYAIYTTLKLIIKPTDIVQIEEGIISADERVTGYVLREETIVKGKANQNGMIQIKMEGEKVSKGDIVYRYKSNNEESLNTKIDEVNKKLEEALKGGQGDILSSDIKAIDLQIENKIENLNNRNNIQEIAEYKKDIDGYVTKKAQIAGESSSAGKYIKKLMDEKAGYQEDIYSGSEYVTATKSGIISYRIDNLEEKLKVDNFDYISKEYLSKLNLKTGQIVSSSSEMGKVVNNFVCYIACNVKAEEAKKAEVGKTLKIRLASQDEVDASISSIKEEKDGSMTVVFRVTESVEELIDYRKVSIDVIWWEKTGLRVPNSSLIYDNGLSYVVRNRARLFRQNISRSKRNKWKLQRSR
jgi:translation initiation factor IF-1